MFRTQEQLFLRKCISYFIYNKHLPVDVLGRCTSLSNSMMIIKTKYSNKREQVKRYAQYGLRIMHIVNDKENSNNKHLLIGQGKRNTYIVLKTNEIMLADMLKVKESTGKELIIKVLGTCIYDENSIIL